MRCFGRRGKFFGARLIGLLVLPSTEVDGGVSATCSGCMVLSLWSTFSPAQPWARHDAPFFQGDGETQCSKVRSNDPSKFARSFSLRGRADWSPTARLDEHRLSANTIDLACAFGEQRRPTALAPLILVCAFGELSKPTVEANSSNVDHIHKILPKSCPRVRGCLQCVQRARRASIFI